MQLNSSIERPGAQKEARGARSHEAVAFRSQVLALKGASRTGDRSWQRKKGLVS